MISVSLVHESGEGRGGDALVISAVDSFPPWGRWPQVRASVEENVPSADGVNWGVGGATSSGVRSCNAWRPLLFPLLWACIHAVCRLGR